MNVPDRIVVSGEISDDLQQQVDRVNWFLEQMRRYLPELERQARRVQHLHSSTGVYDGPGGQVVL